MLADQLREQIHEKISEFNPEVFVVELMLRRSQTNSLVLRIDTDKGISMTECTSVSRQLGSWLEKNEVFEFSYTLEVSSPGIGAPLLMRRQYVKNVGRNLRVVLLDGNREEGCLANVGEEAIELTPLLISKGKKKKKNQQEANEAPAIRVIRFDEIKEAKVIITI